MVHRLWVFVRTLLGTDHRPADIDHLGMIVVLHFLGLWDGIKVGSHEGDRRIPLVLIFVPGYGRFYGTKYF